MLDFDTPIVLVDSSPEDQIDEQNYEVNDYPAPSFQDLHDAQLFDLSTVEMLVDFTKDDPLTDEYFERIHRKPERAEKAIRNGDKGRAQHEKDQIMRLLEGLQGSDWLKVMGVSGITESRRREFEPARAYFVQGCQAVLDKFRAWKEAEKQRKLAKNLTAAGEDEDDDEEEEEEELESGDDSSSSDICNLSDIDEITRQLRQEATSNGRRKGTVKRKYQRRLPPTVIFEEPPGEFRSFFTKAHERQAALSDRRRSGRKIIAWGHAVPNLPERDFDLPVIYRSETVVRQRERERRRKSRVSRV